MTDINHYACDATIAKLTAQRDAALAALREGSQIAKHASDAMERACVLPEIAAALGVWRVRDAASALADLKAAVEGE